MGGVLAASTLATASAQSVLVFKAQNALDIARSNQTVELTAAFLAPLGQVGLDRVHIKDQTGAELLTQPLDMNGDGTYDLLIFQADFGPGQTRLFTAYAGSRRVYRPDQFRAYGRFVRERCEDFAWENDRIAHRMYGRALETWEREPLTSSAVDIWSKRTSALVINDWYMTDNYHEDTGQGADFYSAGLSRGCGGNGLWADGRLWTSRNFVKSRVLANGPIRVCFELEYEPFDVAGISVAEVKRITLDAGHQLNRFQSFYKPYVRPGQQPRLTMAVGLKRVAGEQLELNAAEGWFIKWEPMEKNAGHQGLAVLFNPQQYERKTEDRLNHLVLLNLDGTSGEYWAGFCWDRAGHITSMEQWQRYVAEFARALASPIKLAVEKE